MTAGGPDLLQDPLPQELLALRIPAPDRLAAGESRSRASQVGASERVAHLLRHGSRVGTHRGVPSRRGQHRPAHGLGVGDPRTIAPSRCGSPGRVLLAARHQGDSVWSEPERCPIHVYVCVPELADLTGNQSTQDQVTIAYRGLLHRSRERAEVEQY